MSFCMLKTSPRRLPSDMRRSRCLPFMDIYIDLWDCGGWRASEVVCVGGVKSSGFVWSMEICVEELIGGASARARARAGDCKNRDELLTVRFLSAILSETFSLFSL